jgi:hypothetical protein
LLTFLTWLGNFPFSATLAFVALVGLSTVWITPMFLLLGGRSWIAMLHNSFASVLALNLVLCDLTVATWLNEFWGSYRLVGDLHQSSNPMVLILDTVLIDSVQHTWYTDGTVSSGWNVYASANSPSVNFFNLDFTGVSFFNYYNLTSLYLVVFLLLELPFIPALNFLFFVSLFSMYSSLQGSGFRYDRTL